MSCLRSTTSAFARWPPARIEVAPATTCAAVTTMCGRATQPEPSIPRPHAFAVIRTMLPRTRRTAADASARLSGGCVGGAGPVIAGNGSTRLNARRTVLGGANWFRRCKTGDCCTSRRSFVWPGSCRSTAPATQTMTKPKAAPTMRPPIVSSARNGGIADRPPRAAEPAIDPTDCSTAAPISAPASPTSGVYGDVAPPFRTCAARRAPSTAPTARPASESAVATSPRFSPERAASATIASAIQSTRVIQRSSWPEGDRSLPSVHSAPNRGRSSVG